MFEKVKMFIVNILLIIIFAFFIIHSFRLIIIKTIDYLLIVDSFKEKDELIINQSLNANGKDILIIIDNFNYRNIYEHREHGNKVARKFESYFIDEILPEKKEMDIKLIKLTYDQRFPNFINAMSLLNDKNELALSDSYPLELYLKKVREINPKSKIVVSLSTLDFYTSNRIVDLSDKYKFKISQAYLNSYQPYPKNFELLFIFTFLLDKKNTVFITNKDIKPLSFTKSLDIYDFNHNEILEDTYYYSNSYLAPILGYEYFLNPNSNFIRK